MARLFTLPPTRVPSTPAVSWVVKGQDAKGVIHVSRNLVPYSLAFITAADNKEAVKKNNQLSYF